MGYDYDKMLGDTKIINDELNNVRLFKIGKSCEGRDILCMSTGEGDKKVIALGAFHALEYLTASFLVKFTGDLAKSALSGKEFFGRDVELLLKNVSLFTVPMVNPDGVEIAVNGDGDTKNIWQANARGVDINHNFDADWQPILDGPSPSKYGGEYPHSEEEAKAVVNFVRREQFDMMLCFHSQGEEIYYDFNGQTAPRSKEIADRMAEESGYEACVPEGTACFGGCKDWFIKEFGREGFTIEMGKGTNPLPMKMLGDVYEPNAKIILCAMEECIR